MLPISTEKYQQGAERLLRADESGVGRMKK